MLILTRKIGDSIMINDDIKITYLSFNNTQVRLGIEAPRNIQVHRQEIYERIQDEKKGKKYVRNINIK